MEAAIKAGIRKIVLPNIDLESIEPMKQLLKAYPHQCFAMMGLHPCSVKEDFGAVLDQIEKELYTPSILPEKHKYHAVGEIGIDLYWDKSTLGWQQDAFARQIAWSKDLNLPIAIHVRDAFDETFEVLERSESKGVYGVFHCFTGTVDQAKRAIDLGFKLGIGGVLTFKKAGLDQVLSEIDLKHLVLETDAPYLAPTPYRGKRNEPSYLLNIAEKLAEVKDCGLEEVARITSKNSQELFRL